jgi:hypothetical protein
MFQQALFTDKADFVCQQGRLDTSDILRFSGKSRINFQILDQGRE